MNILITSAGQRVSLVKAFQKELKNIYADGKVYATDMIPHLSAACNTADQYFRVTKCTDPGHIDELINICKQNNIKMIVPTIDTELMVLAQNREKFKELGIYVVISCAAFVDLCRDKRKINTFFQQRGIEIPKNIDKHNPEFPLFIKPFDGSLSVDTYIIHSAKDLRENHLTNERFMFMEYLGKDHYDEYTVDMYFDKTHHLKCIVPRKRILIRAGEINKGLTCKNSIVGFLKEKLSFIEGAVGCLTGQFFLHKTSGRIVGIEINARFGGGYPLSYEAGANYPQWLIREYFKGETISYTEGWEDQLLMLRYDAEVIVHGYKN
jgi:carbamoyl-phosphate synthase large subunit